MSAVKSVVLVATFLLISGCATGGTKPTNTAPPSEPVVLRVSISKDAVTPRGARVDLKVGQPLTLSVRSDTAEEIHVHSDPEREFTVKPGSAQRFTFTVDRPGKVAVEVHHLDAVIAEVLVRR